MKRFGKLLAVVLFAAVAIGADQVQKESSKPRYYGDVSVDKVWKVSGDIELVCDIKNWPDMIGEKIPVVLRGIEMSAEEKPAVENQVDRSAERLNAFVRSRVRGKKVTLKNMARGQRFCIVADVQVGDQDLAAMLITAGLARKAEKKETARKDNSAGKSEVFIASRKGRSYHRPDCGYVKRISSENLVRYTSRQEAEKAGKKPCKNCRP